MVELAWSAFKAIYLEEQLKMTIDHFAFLQEEADERYFYASRMNFEFEQ